MPNISVAESVLGITDPGNQILAMNQAHQTLTGELLTASELQACLIGQFTDLMHTTDGRRILALRDIAGLVKKADLPSASTLSFWPHYQHIFEQHGQKADGNARALLIGAYSALSARSFVVLAHEMYGADSAHVVDIVTNRDTVRHGNFVLGSGLHLPYQSGSFDFVQTNQLLHMLKDPEDTMHTDKQKMLQLIGEIGRVTANGGQVMLAERPVVFIPEEDYPARHRKLQNFATFVTQAFLRRGFEEVETEIPMSQNMRNEELFDPERRFDINPNIPLVAITDAVMVYARKPSLDPIALPGAKRVFAMPARSPATS